MLYLVATPIGNLDDFSQRAVQTLLDCSVIYCEDTRRSSILLTRYNIHKKLISYHKFNEKKSLEEIISLLLSGEKIALISDAGTPCINDPGLILTQECIKNNIPFTLIPGACSPISALILSGMDSNKFQYIGFIPKQGNSFLRQALNYPGTTIALESPSRLVDTLKEIVKLDKDRQIAVVREITKTFEECKQGNVSSVLEHFIQHPPRGEIILVIAQGNMDPKDLSLEETITLLQEHHGLSLKEAIKVAAAIKKIPKRQVYQFIHNTTNDSE